MELADVLDSKLCSSHAVRNLKAFEIQGFPETKNPQKPAPTSKPQIVFKALSRKHLCRRDGIGRRVGLKIQWANHPCGFDPRRRHQDRIIRTNSSSMRIGSDYLFLSSICSFGMVLQSGLSPSRDAPGNGAGDLRVGRLPQIPSVNGVCRMAGRQGPFISKMEQIHYYTCISVCDHHRGHRDYHHLLRRDEIETQPVA